MKRTAQVAPRKASHREAFVIDRGLRRETPRVAMVYRFLNDDRLNKIRKKIEKMTSTPECVAAKPRSPLIFAL